eukprot:PITA_02935
MSNYEKEASIRPPIFDGSNFIYWKVRINAYFQSLGTEVRDIVETGYTFPSTTPTDTAGKKQYETNAKVKRAKLQTLRIHYENLRMYNDESVANYFLHIDEIVNCMKNLGEEIKEVVLVEKLHGILTAYEMRKGGPSDRREAAFKTSGKGDYNELGHMSEEEEESNFVKNLQRGT